MVTYVRMSVCERYRKRIAWKTEKERETFWTWEFTRFTVLSQDHENVEELGRVNGEDA